MTDKIVLTDRDGDELTIEKMEDNSEWLGQKVLMYMKIECGGVKSGPVWLTQETIDSVVKFLTVDPSRAL